MKRGLGILGLCAGLAACGTPEPGMRAVPLDNFVVIQAQEAVNTLLPDPYSSFYRMDNAFQTGAGDYVVCGKINRRSETGSYRGFTPFYVRFSSDQGRVVTKALSIDATSAPEGCRQVAQGVLPVGG